MSHKTVTKKLPYVFRKAICGAPSGTLPRSKNAPLGHFCRPGRKRPARAVLVSDRAPGHGMPKNSNKKQPYAYRKAVCGAPCRSKPEHFCVSGRHRHHAAAYPEVMPVVPPRKDKRGVLKHQGAFAAYPRSTNWAAVFHSPLDISPSLFFRLIAEQPTSPYPDGITESKSKHGPCLVQ